MNRADVIVIALVAVMVVAVACMVVAHHPGANFGSVADWCAAVGTVFAAGTALYIAHHEAKRARELLAEEKADLMAREAAALAQIRLERLRGDAVAVQVANNALWGGIGSCQQTIKSSLEKDPLTLDKNLINLMFKSHHFSSSTESMASISPATAYLSETAKCLSNSKHAWDACLLRMKYLADPGLPLERAKSFLDFDDVIETLRKGYEVHWRLCNDEFNEDLPAEVIEQIEARLPERTLAPE